MKTTQEIKHTPEPWIFREHGVNLPEYGNGIVWSSGGANKGVTIVGVGSLETVNQGEAKIEANARRIVACVNACATLPDPAVVPELVGALTRLMAQMGNRSASNCIGELGEACDQARAILARCGRVGGA